MKFVSKLELLILVWSDRNRPPFSFAIFSTDPASEKLTEKQKLKKQRSKQSRYLLWPKRIRSIATRELPLVSLSHFFYSSALIFLNGALLICPRQKNERIHPRSNLIFLPTLPAAIYLCGCLAAAAAPSLVTCIQEVGEISERERKKKPMADFKNNTFVRSSQRLICSTLSDRHKQLARPGYLSNLSGDDIALKEGANACVSK